MSKSHHCQPVAPMLRDDFNAIIDEFADDFKTMQVAKSSIQNSRPLIRHFLTWLELSGMALEQIDATVIERFLQHDCRCITSVPAPVGFSQWRKRRSAPNLIRFICFLERTNRVPVPDDLQHNFQLLDQYLDGLRASGYSELTIRPYHTASSSLIIWLHWSRIGLTELTEQTLEQFRERQLVCSIPGMFHGFRRRYCTPASLKEVSGFVNYLIEIGEVSGWQPPHHEPMMTEEMERFANWLEHYRGITAKTIRRYRLLIRLLQSEIGDNPQAYNAAMIHQVFNGGLTSGRSLPYIRRLAIATRMYLRFLVFEDRVSPALLAAVPTIPQWRLASLPQYISADDVERAIATCKDHRVGIRNRAVLLLLARLGLRAGDIVALRIGDIDWDRAEIRVLGKSPCWTVLPLPQDVGDAISHYIRHSRPLQDQSNLATQALFYTARAPYRPLGHPGTVTSIAHRALDRAGIETVGNRGAHVFRHSQATTLLRSGASLEVIASLLRHRSVQTTMIYAKTDTTMLQEVAQAWIGEECNEAG